MKADTIALRILAVGVALYLAIPQMVACNRHFDARMAAEKAEQSRLAVEQWNNNVEPLRQACLRLNGIPNVTNPTPYGSGIPAWQVQCAYAPAR